MNFLSTGKSGIVSKLFELIDEGNIKSLEVKKTPTNRDVLKCVANNGVKAAVVKYPSGRVVKTVSYKE